MKIRLNICTLFRSRFYTSAAMSVPENLLSHARSVLEGVKQSWQCGQYADASLSGERGAQAKCHRFALVEMWKRFSIF